MRFALSLPLLCSPLAKLRVKQTETVLRQEYGQHTSRKSEA